jgi:putative membrane protein insertion efficiency factor
VNIAQHLLTFGVRVYRWTLSPAKRALFGPLGRCRFTPSCSAYALEAITLHGARGGSWLAVKRICRCHPWGGCGADPVPPRKSEVRSPKSEGEAGLNSESVKRLKRSNGGSPTDLTLQPFNDSTPTHPTVTAMPGATASGAS